MVVRKREESIYEEFIHTETENSKKKLPLSTDIWNSRLSLVFWLFYSLNVTKCRRMYFHIFFNTIGMKRRELMDFPALLSSTIYFWLFLDINEVLICENICRVMNEPHGTHFFLSFWVLIADGSYSQFQFVQRRVLAIGLHLCVARLVARQAAVPAYVALLAQPFHDLPAADITLSSTGMKKKEGNKLNAIKF